MENILMDKCKSLRCIEWTVQSPSTCGNVQSKTFLLQERSCYLHFYTGYSSGGYVDYPNLSFKCNSELQLPISMTLCVTSNSISSDYRTRLISITNTNQNQDGSLDQNIWSYKSPLINSRLAFELIFHVGYANDDKSVQTPSYIDNCFLMDGVSQEFSKMLSESSSRDVEFICGDQSIKAHKSVLSCRSDVFASMLQSDMVEGKTGRVNIQDMDANRFQQFLKCLYTGVLPKLTVDTAIQFYEAGDKYNINALKKQCADFLSDNLVPENAYDVLILADRHNDSEFKKNVIDFMMKEQMPYSGGKWTDFCKENQTLAIEVLNLFCQHLRPK